MKKVFFILLLFSPSCCFLQAQNNHPDTIQQQLSLLPEDTIKVNKLIDLSIAFMQRAQYDSVLKYVKQVNDLSQKLNFKKGLARGYGLTGGIHQNRGDLKTALYYHWKSFFIKKEIPDHPGLANSLNNIGVLHYQMGNYKVSDKLYKAALMIRRALNDSDGLSVSYHSLGNMSMARDNYPQALYYFFESLKIDERNGNLNGVAESHFAIGLIYRMQNSYEEALKQFNLAWEYKTKVNDLKSIAMIENNFAIIHKNKERWDDALKHYDIALQIANKIQDPLIVTDSYSGLGSVYLTMGNFSEALKSYGAAYDVKVAINDKQGQCTILTNMANIYGRQNNVQLCEKYCFKAMDMAKELGLLNLLHDCYSHLSNLYGQNKYFEKSLDYYKLKIEIRDSIYNEANTKKSVQLEMNYEFNKKEVATKLSQEKRDIIASTEQKRQRIIMFSVVSVLVLVIIFAIFIYRSFLQKKQDNTKILLQKNLIEEKQKEILDSIYYARRIQRALMLNEKSYEKTLRNLRNK